MNGLEEIQEYIKSFVCEKKYMQEEIIKIEEKRTQLAEQRNEKKKANGNYEEINELGRQISELGNQSQEWQNKLDFKLHEAKTQINLIIDNLIAEGIRKIRIVNKEIGELAEKSEQQKERNERYQLQKQEFYVRFGRMPELSERAEKENQLQEKESEKSALEIKQFESQIGEIEEEITTLARIKREVKNGNWYEIVGNTVVEQEICIEEINVEEIEPIEELYVEEFGGVEELYIEEFQPIEEIKIEEFQESETLTEDEGESFELIKESPIDEIEELAKAIIEEIVAEQTRDYNVNKIEEQTTQEDTEDIIIFEQEQEKNDKKEKVIIPLFGQRATISNIIIKIEEGQLVYKAQMSDEEEIKIYPANLGEESVLLRDKQNREECKEILVNYAVTEYKVFDKKVINKIDPLVCELLIECAERYGYDAQELVYNYAMSFSDGDSDSVPGIIYNLSYLEQSDLTRKEKAIINKICRNARKNNKIDIIESFSGFRRIKYIFKRLFAINNVKVLPEAKY